MRDEDLDRLLREDAGDASPMPPPAAPSRRKPVAVAAIAVGLVALALVVLPIVIALSGDGFDMFLGIASGDPGLLF